MNDRPTNPTAAALLGFLHAGPASASDLAALATKRLGPAFNITRSQIYVELRHLLDRGHVTALPTGPRKAQPYRITRTGRTTFRTWYAAGPPADLLRYPVVLWAEFAGLAPAGEWARWADTAIAYHRGQLEQLNALEYGAGATPAAEFARHYHRAALDWLTAATTTTAGDTR